MKEDNNNNINVQNDPVKSRLCAFVMIIIALNRGYSTYTLGSVRAISLFRLTFTRFLETDFIEFYGEL